MGCDIHASVEYEHREGMWFTVCDLAFLPRDYQMFARLVDGHSRDYDKVGGVAPERGLPPLPSALRRDIEWAQAHPEDAPRPAVAWGDHTFSWLTPAEYEKALQLRIGDGNGPGAEWVAIGRYMDLLSESGCVRFVFSFDN